MPLGSALFFFFQAGLFSTSRMRSIEGPKDRAVAELVQRFRD